MTKTIPRNDSTKQLNEIVDEIYHVKDPLDCTAPEPSGKYAPTRWTAGEPQYCEEWNRNFSPPIGDYANTMQNNSFGIKFPHWEHQKYSLTKASEYRHFQLTTS